jgi:hypothetical protein
MPALFTRRLDACTPSAVLRRINPSLDVKVPAPR